MPITRISKLSHIKNFCTDDVRAAPNENFKRLEKQKIRIELIKRLVPNNY